MPIETVQVHAASWCLLLGAGSIHLQGWVPIETPQSAHSWRGDVSLPVAFTPKGGCPLKLADENRFPRHFLHRVAFTPKGGCPLKPTVRVQTHPIEISSSIHPQGWVPIETRLLRGCSGEFVRGIVAFTPKGGCPLKPLSTSDATPPARRSIHPQGWVPIETGSRRSSVTSHDENS